MKTSSETRKLLLKHKKEICRKYHVREMSIFGSYARSEQTGRSDVDILVEFSKPVGFFKFLELEEYLERLLGTKVDLVSKKALRGKIGRSILQERQKI